MLRNRDWLFWVAAGIFVLSLVLGGTVDERFFLLLVVSYLLRPTVHSLGFARTLIDERQLQIQYHASSVAFATMVIGNCVVILYLMGRSDHRWELVSTVLIVAVAVRALAGQLLVHDPALVGPRIVFVVAAVVFVFSAMSGPMGALAMSLPCGVLVALGLAGRKWPRPAAYALFAVAAIIAALMAWFVLSGRSRSPAGSWEAAILIVVPIVVASFCLLRAAAASDDELPTPSTKSRGAVVAA